MSLLVPIVVILLSSISIIILWWIAYPFLLRYYIESDVPTAFSLQNPMNGSNGLNGLNGKNSPETVHGAHGQPGQNSPPGSHGKNGNTGAQGNVGTTGMDGEHGEDGTDGEDGIPGYNAIAVKEDIFNAGVPAVYYVNGVRLDDHIDSLVDKKAKLLKMEKDRILTSLDNLLTKSSDKLLFKIKLDAIPSIDFVGVPSATVLDSILKFKTFITDLNNTYKAQRAINETAKLTQNANIQTANDNLAGLRKSRDLDYEKLKAPAFITATRADSFALFNPIPVPAFPLDGLTDSVTGSFALLVADPTKTFSSEIRRFTSELIPPTAVLNNSDSTVAARNQAKIDIDKFHFYINTLKAKDEEIKTAIDNYKKIILETYDTGTVGIIPHFTFETYLSGGADLQKTNINTARTAITTAQTTYNNNIDLFINPYG